MAATTTAREELIAALRTATGFTVLDHPLKVGKNCVAVQSEDPQIVKIQAYGLSFIYSLKVHVIGGNPMTAGSLKPLEDMVDAVLINLGDWRIDNVEAAKPADGGDGNVFLATTITISKTIHIEGGN